MNKIVKYLSAQFTRKQGGYCENDKPIGDVKLLILIFK